MSDDIVQSEQAGEELPRLSPFDQIRHETANGGEFWSARELAEVLGYARWDKFKNADIKMRHDGRQGVEELPFARAALAMCENIDDNVGRVLKKLDELKIADNTIVLYFSDNGPNSWRWNGGMRGRKGSTDEGGVRSPLLVRWPGHIKPGSKITQITGAIDLLPTLCELTGVQHVGATTHDRSIAKRLALDSRVDVLMHRFNMAHRKATVEVFPAAIETRTPVVVFTATRWGTLLEARADWPGEAPTA